MPETAPFLFRCPTIRQVKGAPAEARLPPGDTLANFEFDLVPMVSTAHVNALAAGGRWLDQGANRILIGNPGGGKSHLAAARWLALVENGFRVL